MKDKGGGASEFFLAGEKRTVPKDFRKFYAIGSVEAGNRISFLFVVVREGEKEKKAV